MAVTVRACAQTFQTLRHQFLSGPARPASDPGPFMDIARRQMLNDALCYGERAVEADNSEQANCWREIALELAHAISNAPAHTARVDETTLHMVGSLLYDVGSLTFATLHRETCGKSLYESWTALENRLKGALTV